MHIDEKERENDRTMPHGVLYRHRFRNQGHVLVIKYNIFQIQVNPGIEKGKHKTNIVHTRPNSFILEILIQH
jgi:hypothetical protein